MKTTIFILTILFFITCKKPPEEKTNYDFSNYGVFVVNEGNFTYGNASLSFIDFEKDTIYNQVFYNATTYPLGDVAQSITLWNNLAFVVINNSGKIYVINSITAEYIGTIKNLSSPRFVEIISDNKAYVSDLYSNTIAIVNPLTFEITGSINIGTPTETITKWHNFVFVTNWNKGNKIFKINTQTDNVDTSIVVNYQPNSLVIDKNNKLWVLCDGGMDVDTSKNDFPALICINPNNMQIEKNIEFSNKLESPTHLNINSTLDTLYYLNSSWNQNISNGGVFKMSIIEEQLPNNAFIAENNRLFYSFGVGKKDEIIISDAVDFAQEGSVFLYSKSGNQIKTFKAGIIPGYFMFNE
ncbi:MAG: YncE family protein [Bacteroidales bacterium]|nr:YncE family protein [Bacteroidales bacterium]